MAKTVLDPPNANKPALSPRQRRQQPRQQGGGLINALSPQEWFQISSQFLNPENNFGSAALGASQGIQETRRNAQMQEREDQLWQRQEQAFEREDQQLAQLEQMRGQLSEYYRAQGDEEFANAIRVAPAQQVAQLFANMSPEARAQAERATEAHNMQMALGQSQIAANLLRGRGGVGDYQMATLRDPQTNNIYRVRANDTPGGGPIEVTTMSGQPITDQELIDRLQPVTDEGPPSADSVLMRNVATGISDAGSYIFSALELGNMIRNAGDDAAQLTGLGRRAITLTQGFSDQLGIILTDNPEEAERLQGALGADAENVSRLHNSLEDADEALSNMRNFFGGSVTPEQAGAFNSLRIAAAFSMALAQNGGRITEQDYRTALEQTTNMSPSIMAAQLEALAGPIESRLRTLYNAANYNIPGAESWASYRDAVIGEGSGSFEDRIAGRNQQASVSQQGNQSADYTIDF